MGVLTATIKSEGNVMSPDFELLSIDITKEFNKIPVAELKFIDGNVSKQEFKILDDRFFEPGKKIEIALKYEGSPEKEASVFAGIVVDQSLELNRATGPTLNIELCDEAIKMTTGRKNTVYTAKSDSDIIKGLVSRNTLKTGTIAKTGVKHTQMVQYYASDWDFMLSRAEANGQLVIANDGKITTVRPEVKTPALTLELGIDEILDFDLQVNGHHQYHDVSSVAWDVTKKTLTKPAKGKEYKLSQGNYNIPDIAKAVGGEETVLVHPVPMEPSELKTWSDAQVIKSRLSLLRGWIMIHGNAKIKVGDTIAIKGVGRRFSGQNIISGVRHEASVNGWVTHIQIGMEACWFTAQTHVTDTQAAGLLPGINGLQIGIVEAHKEDQDNQFRVRVNIPAFDPVKGKEGSIWARLASIDAGPERGVFFRPEKGDEVVVGFLNDDPRQAVILGSIHSKVNKTPLAPAKKNGQKGIFTKSRYQLLFDEENEIITLSTSDKNKIYIDEKQGTISLEDAHKNQVELSKKGIVIISAKDCRINTEGNFNLEAKGNVKIKGKKVDLI